MHHIKIIGKWYWANIIASKLESYDVSFFDPRQQSVTTLSERDTIIIASPASSHYQIVKNIILNSAVKKIFCEKPFVIHHKEALELYALAEDNDVSIYIDDVFCFKNEYIKIKNTFSISDIQSIDISWKKYWDFKDNIFSDLVYHDIYLLYDLLGDTDITLEKITHQNKDTITFSILYWDILVNFHYDRTLKDLKEKTISLTLKDDINHAYNLSENTNDPLWEIVYNFLEWKSDLKYNKELTLFTTQNIETLRKKINPYIAVVWAGIFGITSSWMLAKEWYQVHLYEEKEDIMSWASFNNQYRIHKWYHYPRSISTASASLASEKEFQAYYGASYMKAPHYYSIASEDSKTSPEEYRDFLNHLSLEHQEVDISHIVEQEQISLSLEVSERIYNPFVLRDVARAYLDTYQVKLILGEKAEKEFIDISYDYVILSTFKNNNHYLPERYHRDFNYQLYESVVLDLPQEYKNKSFIILDGNYACISPYGDTGLSVVIGVIHSIHEDTLWKELQISERYHDILDKGIVEKPSITHKEKIFITLKKYFKNIYESQYRWSIFTYKVIIPGSNKNVDRPTEVTLIDDKYINVFSGKVVTCVDAAKTVMDIIKE